MRSARCCSPIWAQTLSRSRRHPQATACGSWPAACAAAKSGAAGFCRAIAREVARFGVTVNNVALGTMRTPATAAFFDEPANAEQVRNMVASYLVRRSGQPDDATWIIAALLSPHASWTTGQTIPVNGGYSFAL